MKNVKRAIVVDSNVRFVTDESQRYPVYGKLYQEGYQHAERGLWNFYLLTEPLPTNIEDDPQELEDLGYEVRYLIEEDDQLKIVDSLE